jgi:hypothetical protein
VAEGLLAEGRDTGGSTVTDLSDREKKTKRSKGLKR